MPPVSDSPLGQEWLFDLVRGLMLRPERGQRPATRALPILVVEGAHGGGKTQLLAGLEKRADQRVPWARVDFGTLGAQDGAAQVLSSLAFQLGRSTPVYGELECPRLTTGLKAMQLKLKPDRRDAARAAVVEALGEERDRAALQEILRESAGTALDVVLAASGVSPSTSAGGLANVTVDALRDRLTRRPRGRRIVLGRYQDWYGHRGRGLTHNSLDVLVDLNQWNANPRVEGNGQKIGELLWDAFLTDLREGFDSARHSKDLSQSALILLDDVDTALGVSFLNGLAAVRGALDIGNRHGPAPVVFAATSRGVLLAHALPGEVAEVDRQERGALPPLDPVPAWLRVRLPDLTAAEISQALTERTHREGDESQLTTMITDLTGGHPASVSLLLTAVARHPGLWSEPAALLDVPATTTEIDPVGVGTLMERVLLGTDTQTRVNRDDLEICAVAVRRQHALWLGTGDDALLAGGLAGFDDIDRVLWPQVSGAAPVLLRRLLLRDLALHDKDRLPAVEGLPDPDGSVTLWGQAFGRMRQNTLPKRFAEEPPDSAQDTALTAEIATGLYYALASGDLEEVVTRFDLAVGLGSSASWLSALGTVVRAPRRRRAPATPALSPMDQMRALASQAPSMGRSTRHVAELVAALWVVNDPFLGNRRRILHRHIAHVLTGLVDRWPLDNESLYETAQRHEDAAGRWS